MRVAPHFGWRQECGLRTGYTSRPYIPHLELWQNRFTCFYPGLNGVGSLCVHSSWTKRLIAPRLNLIRTGIPFPGRNSIRLNVSLDEV